MKCASVADCRAVGTYEPQTASPVLTLHYTPSTSPLTPTGAASRRTHGANAFDIDLPLTDGLGIECRRGGGSNSYDFLIVTMFPGPVTVTGASLASYYANSAVNPPSAGATQSVMANVHHFANYADPQRITLRLNVTDSVSAAYVAVPIGMVPGDTTADGFVNSADIAPTKSRSGAVVGSANFRSDVTVDGNINSADISLVKSKSGTALP